MTARAAYREAYARARLDRRHSVPSIEGVWRPGHFDCGGRPWPGSAVPMAGCYTIPARRGLTVDAMGRVYRHTMPLGVAPGRLP